MNVDDMSQPLMSKKVLDKMPNSKKDTVIRILIVVIVLYTALLIVLIIYFAMSAAALSGTRISYEKTVPATTTQTPVSSPVSQTTPTTKSYTDPNFPNLNVKYDDTWTLASTQKTTPSKSGDVSYTDSITLTKNGATLNITIDPSTGFGWGNSCYTASELSFTKVSDKWFRTANGTKYYYTTQLTQISDMTPDQVAQTKQTFSYTDAQWATFVACGTAGGTESAMAINTNIPTPDTGNYGAVLNIWFDGNTAQLAEADAIISSSSFAAGSLGN